MPNAPTHYCLTNGCSNRVKMGQTYCETCQSKKVQCITPGCHNMVTKRDHSNYCHRCREIRRGERERERGQNSGRGEYAKKSWKDLRKSKLLRDPLCEECQRVGRTALASKVDHIVPHRGDLQLFYDWDNLQSLCESCHNRKSAQEKLYNKE